MLDPREYAAFWGACGGVLLGATDLVTAYSATAGTIVARRKAWLHLALGLLAGPVLAEAFTPLFLTIVPVLPMQVVAMSLGWIGGNDPRQLFAGIKKLMLRNLKEEP